jgi:hypothetical protein
MLGVQMDRTGRKGMGLRWLATVAAIATGILAMGPAPASAGVLVKSAPSCEPGELTQPFSRWGDRRAYELAPGGSFEDGAPGWQLRGASIVPGNESFQVRGSSDSRSLRLDGGETATSPEICVGLEHPTIRLFARNNRLLLSALSVEVIVTTSLGLKLAVPIGVVLPRGSWKPTPGFLVVGNLLPLLPGHHTPVTFRFRAVGGGSWWIDDFYVDPRRTS